MASTTALGDGPVTPTVTFNATGTPWPSPQSNAAINNDDDPPSGTIYVVCFALILAFAIGASIVLCIRVAKRRTQVRSRLLAALESGVLVDPATVLAEAQKEQALRNAVKPKMYEVTLGPTPKQCKDVQPLSAAFREILLHRRHRVMLSSQDLLEHIEVDVRTFRQVFDDCVHDALAKLHLRKRRQPRDPVQSLYLPTKDQPSSVSSRRPRRHLPSHDLAVSCTIAMPDPNRPTYRRRSPDQNAESSPSATTSAHYSNELPDIAFGILDKRWAHPIGPFGHDPSTRAAIETLRHSITPMAIAAESDRPEFIIVMGLT